MTMSQVRDSLQSLVAKTLADPAAGHGYSLAAIVFAKSVELTLEKGGGAFVVWLEPADAGRPCYRHTARFNVGHRGEAPDRAGYAALDALCERLLAWERSLGDDAHASLFDTATGEAEETLPEELPHLEWLALRAGLKPACRSVVSAAVAARAVAAARRLGLRVRAIDAGAFVTAFCAGNKGCDTIVYAARDDDALDRVVAAEAAMIADDARGRGAAPAEQVRALGIALGYPPCCIDAFLPVRDLPNGVIRFHALGRTAGTPSFLLNDTVEGRVLVSHAVCRYDCGASVAYGRALFAAAARADPAGAAALAACMRGLVFLFENGDVLRLAPRPDSSSGELFRFAGVEARGDGPALVQWQAALADADAVRHDGLAFTFLRGASEIGRLAAPSDQVRAAVFR